MNKLLGYHKYLAMYALTSTIGGGVYKASILWDGKIEAYINNEKRMRRMLLGEKLLAFSIGVVYSPILTPVWLYDGINRFDIYMMRKKPADFGYETKRTTIYDYIYN